MAPSKPCKGLWNQALAEVRQQFSLWALQPTPGALTRLPHLLHCWKFGSSGRWQSWSAIARRFRNGRGLSCSNEGAMISRRILLVQDIHLPLGPHRIDRSVQRLVQHLPVKRTPTYSSPGFGLRAIPCVHRQLRQKMLLSSVLRQPGARGSPSGGNGCIF